MLRFLLYSLLLLLSGTVQSQVYKPLDTADYVQRKAFIYSFAQENAQYIQNLKAQFPGKTGNELEKMYKEFEKDFLAQVKNKDFIFKSPLDADVALLIAKLRKNNPEIPQKLRILIAKDNAPNAFCLADGTFVINLGLFHLLDNEDQMASVLAHELGHNIGKHTLYDFVHYIRLNQMDKSTVRTIKTSLYNRNHKAFELLRNRLYKKSEESRRKEISADSLGYALFRKSEFAKPEYINALQNLKTYDTILPIPVREETYRKYFGLPGLSFKDQWMQKEDFSVYNYKKINTKIDEDSVATHPEIPQRILALQNYFSELKNELPSAKPSAMYQKAEYIAKMEILPNFVHAEQYGLGIYTCLQFLQENTESAYHEKWLGECFAKIYQARKDYTLNRYLDRVNPKDQNESYQQFLNFMWNLSLADIKNIADFYHNKKS